MRFLMSFFALLSISGLALGATASESGCLYMNQLTECLSCFNSERTPDYKCIPNPEGSNCLMEKMPNFCVQCKEGYAVNSIFRGGAMMETPYAGKCHKADVPTNCVQAHTNGGKVTCSLCKNGFYPNFSATACDSKSGLANCLWAGRNFKENSAECWQCQDGYMLDKSYNCVKQTSSMVGCARFVEEGSSLLCDGNSGYFMKSPKRCSK